MVSSEAFARGKALIRKAFAQFHWHRLFFGYSHACRSCLPPEECLNREDVEDDKGQKNESYLQPFDGNLDW